MEAVRTVLFIATPFLLLSVLLTTNPHVQAVEIITQDESGKEQGDPPPVVDVPANTGVADPAGDPSGDGKEGMAAVIARNRAIDDLFSRGATRDMWMVLVCMGLQDIVNDCRRIQSFE
ncbi:hypothetical protein BaRGS_00017583 [Batillaria attramentaria]|uniref:Uncharacterized protein n=1 Tax=Batillaria attramentaria TaxID=370345 RepID=A0ABD0KVQ3_9CAEN